MKWAAPAMVPTPAFGMLCPRSSFARFAAGWLAPPQNTGVGMSDHRFKNLRLVGNIGIESGAPFDRAAISEQTCGDAAKTVLPLCNDGSPCSAGAA